MTPALNALRLPRFQHYGAIPLVHYAVDEHLAPSVVAAGTDGPIARLAVAPRPARALDHHAAAPALFPGRHPEFHLRHQLRPRRRNSTWRSRPSRSPEGLRWPFMIRESMAELIPARRAVSFWLIWWASMRSHSTAGPAKLDKIKNLSVEVQVALVSRTDCRALMGTDPKRQKLLKHGR